MLDLALASDLEARFRLPVANTDEAVVAELLRHPATMLGLSDAGAHASQLCDACAPTDLLGTWVREKGVLSLEEGVRRLTSATADVFGLRDRGRLARRACAADVVVFDPDTVGCWPAAPRARFPGRRRPPGRRRDRHPRRRRERHADPRGRPRRRSIRTARCPATCCAEDERDS